MDDIMVSTRNRLASYIHTYMNRIIRSIEIEHVRDFIHLFMYGVSIYLSNSTR